MIKRWIVTGDTHGNTFTRLKNIQLNMKEPEPEETGIIILGDAGINYYFSEWENRNKKHLNKLGYKIYCVRGNHEERPENIPTMGPWYDEDVKGIVFREPEYPNIHYLKDGEIYTFGAYTAFILGGAYSVDKDWRIQTGKCWFPNEQLTESEMRNIESYLPEIKCDFVFSHTCPLSWQPRDLFLPFIDQSKVDNTMEKWLEEIKNKFSWKFWLFGHYHDDRLVRPRVEMFFNDYEYLDDIVARWNAVDGPPWWMKKDPNYYMEA